MDGGEIMMIFAVAIFPCFFSFYKSFCFGQSKTMLGHDKGRTGRYFGILWGILWGILMDTLIACFSGVVFLSYCVEGMSQNACTALSDGELPKKTTNLFVMHLPFDDQPPNQSSVGRWK